MSKRLDRHNVGVMVSIVLISSAMHVIWKQDQKTKSHSSSQISKSDSSSSSQKRLVELWSCGVVACSTIHRAEILGGVKSTLPMELFMNATHNLVGSMHGSCRLKAESSSRGREMLPPRL